jgi:uncharacterized membrane protein
MVDPSSPPQPSSRAATVPTASGSGLPQNVAAGLACVFSLIGGVIFLFIDRANRFVRFHALQAIYIGIFILGVSFVFRVAQAIFSQIPFIGTLMNGILGIAHLIISLVWFAAYVATIVQAFRNVEWALPYFGPLVRRQIGSGAAESAPEQPPPPVL